MRAAPRGPVDGQRACLVNEIEQGTDVSREKLGVSVHLLLELLSNGGGLCHEHGLQLGGARRHECAGVRRWHARSVVPHLPSGTCPSWG
jgi:hypothetical protein